MTPQPCTNAIGRSSVWVSQGGFAMEIEFREPEPVKPHPKPFLPLVLPVLKRGELVNVIA